MRALMVAALLLSVPLFVASPAAADCQTRPLPGDSFLRHCDDENGNAVPDQVLLRLNGNYVMYNEFGYCWGSECRNITFFDAYVAAQGVSVDGDLDCENHVGNGVPVCDDADVQLVSPAALATVNYDLTDDGVRVCAGGRVPLFAPMGFCTGTP